MDSQQKSSDGTEADLGGGARGARPSCFLQSSVFFFAITLKNYKLLFEVELIINNASLTYAYPNTIRTFYTQSFVIWQTVIILF